MTRSRLSALLVLLLPSVALAQGVSFRQTFDTVNLALNKGDGYKTSSNNSGTLAWGESYIMMSYAVMFRGTGDPAYLLRLADHALSVLDQRDNKKGLKDFAGKSRPCWQSAKYSNNKKGYCWVVHSGMISYPMADLALLVQQNPKLGSLKVKGSTTLAAAAATVLAEVQKVVATHDFQYKSGPSSGEGHYRGDPAAGATIGTSLAGKALPLNQMNALGRTLVVLWKRTGQAAYLTRAKGLATYLRNRMTKNGSAYAWTYWGTPWKQGGGEDISHAAINADFAKLCQSHGLIFTASDALRLARTVYLKIHRTTDACADRVDGSGTTGNYTVQVGRWLNLAPHEPRVWPVAANVLRKVTKSGSGSTILGLALVARYAPAVRDYYFYYVDWKDLGSYRQATAYGANILMLPPTSTARYVLRLGYRGSQPLTVDQWDGKQYHKTLGLAPASAWQWVYVPYVPALYHPYWKKGALYQLTGKHVAGKGVEVMEVATVKEPVILTQSLPDAIAGSAYVEWLVGSGDKPLIWSLKSAPAGMFLGPSNTLTWKPTAAHSPSVKITVALTNDSGQAVKTFTIPVKLAPPDAGPPDASMCNCDGPPPPPDVGIPDKAQPDLMSPPDVALPCCDGSPPPDQGPPPDICPCAPDMASPDQPLKPDQAKVADQTPPKPDQAKVADTAPSAEGQAGDVAAADSAAVDSARVDTSANSEPGERGCSCAVGREPSGAGVVLLMLLALLRRRKP